ncbi:hypothetical protein Rsub_11311 [Raphidocelis subcapitata]|uniref:EF-hand domain-containing protein n=1 Tax=Raphidocelis subcapitata TaxID=307507 RepID=A0A2V0PFL8_9CHLO|nr:hypothetical protein Rsub_11311 [Raphidocelis subcapitata]|eukprot:GBF98586.1 hypothetical protein Rsub_11311 [Raphidocelis subcapitata]
MRVSSQLAGPRGRGLVPVSAAPPKAIATRSVRCQATTSPDFLERLLGAQRLQVLDRTEKDLFELCSDLANDEEKRRCWEVYAYFKERRAGAQSSCVAELEETGARGTACETFDSLERMVYELMSSGRTKQLYNVLKVESELSKRGGGARPHKPSMAEQELEEYHAHLRARADELFELMDRHGDGVVDREEFILAMNMLRDELGWDEAELGTVFSAIDCHGHVTREQFADILVAEELRDPTADAELLRHLSHARPNWWTDCPNTISTL